MSEQTMNQSLNSISQRKSSEASNFEEDTTAGWVETVKGQLPNGATVGGRTEDGEDLYIARGMIGGCFFLGSLRASDKVLHVAWRKKDYKLKNYQVLVYANGKFEPLEVEDEIPIGSVSGGSCVNDEDVFIGRVNHEDALIVGTILPSEGTCQIAHKGQPLTFKDNFEVFTMKEEEKKKH